MLRLISYLSPSIPAGFFELVARAISKATGSDVALRFDETISGPLRGDRNPFGERTAEIGFVCSPTLRWLKDDLELLPVPVPTDERAAGRPVYFGDVAVRADSEIADFDDLRGGRWAYNDRNSRSGWFSMIERVSPRRPDEYFADVVAAGSHLESLRWIESGRADGASIDSNALLDQRRRRPELSRSIRVIESWGPFPIQPIVIRSDVPRETRNAVRGGLLAAHESFGSELRSFGFDRFAEVDRSVYA